MELNQIYFYTATIKDWATLLFSDKRKDILIDSLRYLVRQKKIALYGFVIMPNHIHLLWEMLEMNGKEMPYASFMKFTAHEIQKQLIQSDPKLLEKFKVNLSTREYQFWKRDSLPKHAYSSWYIYQKLDYIHNNPVQGRWMLAPGPDEYHYSSARFYDTGVDDFDMLTHIDERIR
ncbi:MAG: transposase [Roseivirga sp.]